MSLEEGGGEKDCEVMEGESGVREDVEALLVTLRIKDREEAWCSRVGCQTRAAKCKLLLRAAVGLMGRLLFRNKSWRNEGE